MSGLPVGAAVPARGAEGSEDGAEGSQDGAANPADGPVDAVDAVDGGDTVMTPPPWGRSRRIGSG
ncbi:hypothetical protein SLI_1566 [Streptomyces lividans 1326]|uniref:Uncharacterized protein n=1 Tax=Streptomyces lividans 1326 TaxID=1200984 RepID=A0A7U9DSK1_STRLI|nr:hypothetical protein SLI_1566 [Streptomyces lividans 1326]